MIYVYDVLVNLNEELYDFYDWEDTDNFLHVRRVPIFKIEEKAFFDMTAKKVKINNEFLTNIKDKTQIFGGRNIEIIKSACIFSDGKNAIMLEFNDKGEVKKKSKFLINEEIEIIDVTTSMKTSKIDYETTSNKINRNTMIRSEKKTLKKIIEELENLKEDSKKIDYLYYEWFETEEGNNKYEKLLKAIKNKFTNKHEELLELLNLLTIKK